jgi:hypothetical protein
MFSWVQRYVFSSKSNKVTFTFEKFILEWFFSFDFWFYLHIDFFLIKIKFITFVLFLAKI